MCDRNFFLVRSEIIVTAAPVLISDGTASPSSSNGIFKGRNLVFLKQKVVSFDKRFPKLPFDIHPLGSLRLQF